MGSPVEDSEPIVSEEHAGILARLAIGPNDTPEAIAARVCMINAAAVELINGIARTPTAYSSIYVQALSAMMAVIARYDTDALKPQITADPDLATLVVNFADGRDPAIFRLGDDGAYVQLATQPAASTPQ